ncbi:MAG: efflux RND transporter permease subunit [Planctomycetota bacterium]
MARHPMAANLLMVVLIGGGVWAALKAQKEVFPQFELDVVSVGVGYPGAAPSEVEQGILRPVEEAIRGVDGIREITSTAREGRGSVSIELVSGADRGKAFQDVEQAVSRIRTFPDDIEQPEVQLRSRQREVMTVGLYGDIDVWALRKLGEQLRDELRATGEITQIELGNAPGYVTHVEIPREQLRVYGLTLPQIAARIEASSEDVAAGSLEANSGEVLLRVASRKQLAPEFEKLELIANDNGGVVRLGDIAHVYDGFEDAGFHSLFNQKPSIEIDIYRVGDQSPLRIAKVVSTALADFEARLPAGVSVRIDNNNAEDFRRRLGLVIHNGLVAVAIVLVILALFLETRLAFWVMMGMAISFIGGVLALPGVDVSINMISLFGFLIVLGIVVDDAVVVGENVYEHRSRGEGRLAAAVHGAREVAGPVTFSILTNIVAFIPLLFIPGETGKFWSPLPVVVIVVLAVSLFEALFILPAHLAHVKRGGVRTGLPGRLHGAQQSFSRGFSAGVDRLYRPLLARSLRYRYVTVAAGIAVFVVVAGYASSAHMGLILMPEVSADEIEAGIRLPVGTTPDQAAEIALAVTEASLQMFERHNLDQVAEGIKTNVRGGTRFVDVEIVMKPPDERDMTSAQVIELWRQSIGDLPGVVQISFEAERGPGGFRQDISVDLSHNDINVLEQATAAFVQQLQAFSNTRDVNDNYNKGKKQFDIELLPEGRALGFTPDVVGEQLRGAFVGSLALRLLRGTDEIEVRVKLPEAQRKDLYHLEDLIVRSPDGVEAPLLDVARLRESESFTSITRRNGRRIVNVSADVEPNRAVGRVISALETEVLPALRSDFPGLTWSFEGADAELREATSALWSGYLLAMLVIYALLAVAFGSYLQPVIVLAAIPFGVVGAVLGHILLGYDLSLISMMGMIALSGVVVNDSLIMIDYANKRRGEASAFDAMLRAGVRRFRPIFLTTATTFAGLTPIIFEPSLQAQYIIPMAISLGFGIVFSTAVILLLVPCLYLILDDVGRIAKNRQPAPPTQ